MSASKATKRNTKGRNARIEQRADTGFSLVAVAAILIISSLWASAMMGAMLPTYERITTMKVQNLARSSAEAGIDYAIGSLNAAIGSAQPSQLDATIAGASKTTQLPTSITGNSGSQVSVTVYNESPPTTSMLYDPNIAYLVSKKLMSNPYRRIEAHAALGGTARTVRVIVAPILSSPNFVPFAIFGNSAINIVGLSAFDSYNLATGDPFKTTGYMNSSDNYDIYADVGSNGSITILGSGASSRGIKLGGSYFSFPEPADNQAFNRQNVISQFNSTPTNQAPWIKIYDNVYSNQDTSGLWPRGQYPNRMNSWNNVYGWSNPGPTDPHSSSKPGPNGVVSPYDSFQKLALQPAPASPAGTFNLGNVTLSNEARITFRDNAALPSGPLGRISDSNVNLPPGNYVMSALTVTGDSKINVNSSSPVSIYFEGTSPGGTVISVSSDSNINMNSAGAASKLRIYYNGSQRISLNGNTKGIVYAPNASVYLGQGLNEQAHFYGSLVGGTVNVNGGLYSGAGAYVHFDAALRQGNTAGTATMLNSVKVTGLKAVSWQEL
jgi:hypothetical protein